MDRATNRGDPIFLGRQHVDDLATGGKDSEDLAMIDYSHRKQSTRECPPSE